jgi:hypothetical protein
MHTKTSSTAARAGHFFAPAATPVRGYGKCVQWLNKRHLIQFTCVGAVLLATACNQKTASTTPTPTALGTGAEVAHLHGGPVADQPDVNSLLAAVRVATAKYHDVEAATAAGYQLGYRGLVTGCVANPGVGAMGYHYFNSTKMDDPSINEDDPEVLVYHTADDGSLVLGAVEWVVPKSAWEAAGNTAPPVVFGHTLHVINPVLNWYIEHAWIWTENPSGMFSDWNPKVTCP